MKEVASRLSGISFVVATAALLVGFAHHWFGPIEPAPAPEQVAAEKVVAASRAAWARFQHRDLPPTPPRDGWGTDRAMQVATSFLGTLALLLAAVAYARGERKRHCIAAGAVGAVAALLPAIGLIALVGLVVLVVTFLPIS